MANRQEQAMKDHQAAGAGQAAQDTEARRWLAEVEKRWRYEHEIPSFIRSAATIIRALLAEGQERGQPYAARWCLRLARPWLQSMRHSINDKGEREEFDALLDKINSVLAAAPDSAQVDDVQEGR